MIQLKKDSSKILVKYFDAYTGKTIMEYELFNKFCRDFDIFPEMCSKTLLHSIFYELSEAQRADECKLNPDQMKKIMMSKIKNQVFTSGEYLNQERFIDAVIICALKCRFLEQEARPIPKVILFLEKLFQSKGTQLVKMQSGKIRMFADEIDPMSNIRKKYEKYTKSEPMATKKDALNKAFEDNE